eukprot:CAMPEP_0113957968 /NCGR_PEP_ID=MMETSP0011_2-20120614/3078_1 /TAXON_ID=101924 /ORGANISM="Rhodosorus marinus" /LENGTH=1285 /DNA_ID=CAMNT_0000968617 /DNA_START=628 /DNA_END=4485 /DNA_ORIENTATION=+ /assembly_acc=CAM_ASM_000156
MSREDGEGEDDGRHENSRDVAGKGPAELSGDLVYSARGRLRRRVNLNEEEMFEDEQEDERPLIKRKSDSLTRRRSYNLSSKSESQSHDSSPGKLAYTTRAGRTSSRNSKYDLYADSDDNDSVVTETRSKRTLLRNGERTLRVQDEREEDADDSSGLRRSSRKRNSSAPYAHRDDHINGEKMSNDSVKEEPKYTPRSNTDGSSDEGKPIRRSGRLRRQPSKSSPLREDLASPKTNERQRLRRVRDREQRYMRRSSQPKPSPFEPEHESDDFKRTLRPRSSRRSLREVPDSQIEVRRRSRDSSDDAYSANSSEDDDTATVAHMSEEEKYDMAKTANQMQDLPPRELRQPRERAQVPAHIADLAREARDSRRPRSYRPRVRDILFDQVKTGGESKKPAIEPVKVDSSITWDVVGGLDSHIRALKEMVLLPLLYPEVFKKFKLEPPKGVLFYGPPGTGKTLCARALAASAGTIPSTDKDGKPVQMSRVSFFIRNGADCLSKWVGEAERNLRQLFEVAKKHQPSIIFFDEIDGLAPVRSSRQDQIHSSIVSTLLGLMDGLEARGQIVVIGATNRVDSIDPALRRAGRFDRELIFKLPNHVARRRILDIHTSKWDVKPEESLLRELADRTVGYCGADLKSLCTEASLRALRRRYPQIYKSQQKLEIDPDQVKVMGIDFFLAMQSIVPSSHRSSLVQARPLSGRVAPLLDSAFGEAKKKLRDIFRQGTVNSADFALGDAAREDGDSDLELYYDEEVSKDSGHRLATLESIARSMQQPTTRPRLLVCGKPGMGQVQLAPAILHALEGCPVFGIGMTSLFSDQNAKTQEEALVTAFREASRAAPSVLYIPHLDKWWDTAADSLRATFSQALQDMPTLLPVLVLASSQCEDFELARELQFEFVDHVSMDSPTSQQRYNFFGPLLMDVASPAIMVDPSLKAARDARHQEVLKVAPPPERTQPSEEERARSQKSDEQSLRAMRMEMRELLARLLNDRKYMVFWNPVDPEEASDYYEIIKRPIDLSMIAANVDAARYSAVMHMVSDVDLMVQNAIEYNPPHTEQGARILRRAHALIDLVHCWADALDKDLVSACNQIVVRKKQEEEKKRKQEGEKAKVEEENKRSEEEDKKRKVESDAVESKPSNSVSALINGTTTADDVVAGSGMLNPDPMQIEPPAAIAGADVGTKAEVPKDIGMPGFSNEMTGPSPLNANREPMGKPIRNSKLSSDVKSFLDRLVAGTETANLDTLETLHGALAAVLYANRRNPDRGEVLKSLEQRFERLKPQKFFQNEAADIRG